MVFRLAAIVMVWAVLCLPAAAQNAGDVLHTWEFDDPSFEMRGTYGCTAEVRDGKLVGEIEDAHGVFMVFPEVDIPAPVTVKMRAKTTDTFGRAEVYWLTDKSSGWGMDYFMRFFPKHDGEWHEYEVRLPIVEGRLKAFRLMLGWKPGEYEIDWIRFEADPLPQAAIDNRNKLPESVVLEDERLHLELEPKTHQYTVRDKESGRVWTANGDSGKTLLAVVNEKGEKAVQLVFWDHAQRTHYFAMVSLPEPGVLSFELESEYPEGHSYSMSNFPPKFETDFEHGKMVFCDRSCGVYADQDDDIYSGRMLMVYGNTSCTDMPWVGVVDPESGEGLMTLVETPYDAFMQLHQDEQGRAWPQVQWRATMDTFGYPRRLSYRFASEGGYVRLAKMYREYAREQGLLVTLEEKAERKPAAALLKGAPVVWGSWDAMEWVRQARTEGIMRGVISNASHGLRDHSSLREINRMGYITLDYDSFADILDGPTGFNMDDVEETAVHSRPGLGPKGGWVDDLNSYFTRSSIYAMRAITSYVPEALVKYGFNGRFIDVCMAIDLHEDYHPEHTFDRRQDLAYRREAYAWYGDQGLPLGTEHGNDWGIDLVEYTEGSMSGPFWWMSSKGWNAGQLRRVQSRDAYSEPYLKFGIRHDTRVPLWQLVYSDCAVSTWYWGDCAGFHYEAAPEIAEGKDLFNILYGGVALFWRDNVGYGWNRNRDRFVKSYHETAPLHGQLGFEEMLSHEFLTDDMAVQRTRFSGGYTVVVNFGDAPFAYTTDTGEAVTLAPRGYHAEGPDTLQTKHWVDGEPVLHYQMPGYHRFKTKAPRNLGPANVSGHVIAFQVSPTRWQLKLYAGSTLNADMSSITGWDALSAYTMLELDEMGDPIEVLATDTASSLVQLEAGESHRFIALDKELPFGSVVVYPAAEWVEAGTPIRMSVAARQGAIHYTLDGSEPTLDSPVYDGALALEKSVAVRARAFRGKAPMGPEAKQNYRAVQSLFESGIMRGGDEAKKIDVALDGFESLRIVVTLGDDFNWSDWANLGDAKFVTESGEEVYLSDLDPTYWTQTYNDLGRDKTGDDGTPLKIAGRSFERGLGLYSEADVRYALPGNAARFEAWAGIDDLANPGEGANPALIGSVEFIIQGVVGAGAAPAKVKLIPLVVDEVVQEEKLTPAGTVIELPEVAFDMQAPWMDGGVRLRIPEVLVSTLGVHFVDHIVPGRPQMEEVFEEYPEWRTDPFTGAIYYQKRAAHGLEFGCTALAGEDEVELEFRVVNRSGKEAGFVSPNHCLTFDQTPGFDEDWNINKLLCTFHGALQPMANTTPTPADKGNEYPWLHFFTGRGLGVFDEIKDMGPAWFVDQVMDGVNLMAAESADGKHLIGYTWARTPDTQMSNCGNPCLHTGNRPSNMLMLGEEYVWRGKVYFVENDRDALLARAKNDQEAWRKQGFE